MFQDGRNVHDCRTGRFMVRPGVHDEIGEMEFVPSVLFLEILFL
jgi:hypothetical protein